MLVVVGVAQRKASEKRGATTKDIFEEDEGGERDFLLSFFFRHGFYGFPLSDKALESKTATTLSATINESKGLLRFFFVLFILLSLTSAMAETGCNAEVRISDPCEIPQLTALSRMIQVVQ